MTHQGLFGAAMLPMAELEYTGIMEKLAVLEGRFTVRSWRTVKHLIKLIDGSRSGNSRQQEAL